MLELFSCIFDCIADTIEFAAAVATLILFAEDRIKKLKDKRKK